MGVGGCGSEERPSSVLNSPLAVNVDSRVPGERVDTDRGSLAAGGCRDDCGTCSGGG